MYAYRLGIAIMIAALYALVWGAASDINFLIIGSLAAVAVGIFLAVGGAGAAKYDENRRYRELLEALGKKEEED